MDLDALRDALAPRYLVREWDEYVQIADAEGNHIALGVVDPLVVQVDLGVVFMRASRPVQELVPEAHSLLEAHFEAHFASLGFTLGEGDLVEGEVVGDPDTIITSWERPMTAEVDGPAALLVLLDQVGALDTELVL